MSLARLNAFQQAEVLQVVFKTTASSTAPLLLLESFVIGVLCACIPLGTYLLWVRPHSFSCAPFISLPWIVLVTLFSHWIASIRQLEGILTGQSLGISLTVDDVYRVASAHAASSGVHDLGDSYLYYGEAWEFFLPLVTETVLFGFSTTLFVIAAYISFKNYRSYQYSRMASAVHVAILFMYILSLVHWVVLLRYFNLAANHAASDDLSTSSYPAHTAAAFKVTLLTLLSFNTVMSDFIVLWRVYVIWDRARSWLALGGVWLIILLALNVANIVGIAAIQFGQGTSMTELNTQDSEVLPTYGMIYVGVGAAFMSLATNLSATLLVGLKAWLLRWRIYKHFHSSSRRTFTERVMELVVDSGIAYAAIWLVYCISLYRPITRFVVLGQDPTVNFPVVTTASHLDAAMAQITSIYPLIIFILVAIDKIHYLRGPQVLLDDELPGNMDTAVTVTVDVVADRDRIIREAKGMPYSESSMPR
ncbi:unnamed protein product [Peniophora sp. CBMAI 1063]|nr:unnamed protein product [Peniophora sp. CBMAI 1063]